MHSESPDAQARAAADQAEGFELGLDRVVPVDCFEAALETSVCLDFGLVQSEAVPTICTI